MKGEDVRRYGRWLLLSAMLQLANFSSSAQTLRSLVQDLEAHPAGHGPQWAAELDAPITAASLSDIQDELPAVVGMTESPDAQLRGSALLLLYGIAVRSAAGQPASRRERDLSADEAIVPYIGRLAPRLEDQLTSNRSVTLILFQALSAVHPAPPELIKVCLEGLRDPRSTQAVIDTTHKSPDGKAPSIGPQVLWILLSSAATFYRDPVTHITEGRDTPEVVQAVVTFLQRPDQTPESISESIRALALAQAQNPEINSHLLRFLDSTVSSVQKSLLNQIANLTLTPEDFTSARQRVEQLAASTSEPEDIQKLAKSLLVCWANDRHHGVCPAPAV